MTKRQRPILIKLAIAFLVIMLAGHLIALYRMSAVMFASGVQGFAVFAISIGMAILQLLTLERILSRARTGRRLAVLTFVLMGLTGIFNGVELLNWPGPPSSNLYLAKAIVITRIAASFFFAFLFAMSKRVENYFTEDGLKAEVE